MKSVNIGALRNNLSAYLHEVRNGEEIVVRDRDEPVARIVPFGHGEPEDEEEARLVAEGVLKAPEEEMDWSAFWALPRPTVSDEAAREAIRWAKGER
jgi:prevent-host-death family protein